MINIIDVEKCDGCSTCIDSCPMEVLGLVDGRVKIIDGDMCTDCQICVEVCPQHILEVPI